MTTLPKIDRRAWLALWAQKRRRARHALPAPLLWAEYPGLLKWDWDLPDPYRWNVWQSWDGGASWTLVEDYWATGGDRDFFPDGGHELYFIVGVDANGVEVTGHSNIVRPDDAPRVDSLLDGLHEFYRPPTATSRVVVNSYGETEEFDGDPFVGMSDVTETTGSGYVDMDVAYWIVPFREVNGVREYASIIRTAVYGYVSLGNIEWPTWGDWPEWPTGFLVVQAWDPYLGREISKATMMAGWVDDNTGWGALPFSFTSPPSVPKTLWRRSGEGTGANVPITTLASPLGGLAFDLTGGGHLARQMADDAISRSMDVTIAYWVCPAYTGHTSMWLGGSWTWQLIGEQFDRYQWQTTPPPDVNFIGVTGLDDTMANCQYGDWFLVVQRGNTVADTLTQDVYRLRDGHHQQVMATLSNCDVNPMSEAPANYFADGLHRVLAFGSGYWWGNEGAAYVDRMGTWTRPLSDDEVDRLWSLGLGWEPA